MNPHQLVIRCDTTNGFYKVGWASELPLGRFQHIELLSENDSLIILNSTNSDYNKACSKVCDLNATLIIEERKTKLNLGWFSVDLNLNDTDANIVADKFGCFNELALKTRYRLSKNSHEVWAAINNNEVVYIEARYPTQRLDELKYQTWKHQKLAKLSEYANLIKQGKLVVCNSGLWFVDANI